jgi:ubiquinone/menaquinone biosynthesis C-methylase UbiE
MNDDISTYLSGTKLYGDDFTIDEIQKWFADEAEGYANLGAKEKIKYQYVYHELNNQHGFKHIRKRRFNEALGVGSAYGTEFKPISDNINRITILDPSDAFSDIKEVLGTPCEFIKPNSNGNMPFRSNQFDLITCFGVMHHIPNVSHVMSECYRCLDNGGIMLFREPITSMGDWTVPRAGLTKRERGIPLHILNEIVLNAGFKVKQKSLCNFPLLPKLANKIGGSAYNSYSLTMADKLFSQAFSWNIKYHRTKLYEKIAPASVYFVLNKQTPKYTNT